jgi:hypothetical protein
VSSDFENELVDTGFDKLVTATVTAPEPPAPAGLTPEGLEALKALVALPADKSTPQFLMRVSADFAMDIHTTDAILAKHGLSHAQYEFLSQHNEFFKQALLQQAREWGRLTSTQDRLKAEAAAALEEQLPVIAMRMGQRGEKLGDAVEAAKLFAKIAGVDTSPSGPGTSGERFTINIDLGADERITARSGPPPVSGVQTIEGQAVHTDAKRTG